MTKYDFDQQINRRGSDSSKWTKHIDDDVTLPMWLADMDFPLPSQITEAIKARVDEQFLGYAVPPQELRDVLVDRMKTQYDWSITSEQIMFLPGVVVGLHIAVQRFMNQGEGVLMPTPVYAPFFNAVENNNREVHHVSLQPVYNGQDIRYEIDFDAFESAIQPNTKMLMLCNPHNPIGRVFTREELARMAEICIKHDLLIITDDVHSDLVFGDHKHIPIASLSPEIADRTVTLMAATKTFSMPGLSAAFAISHNENLLKIMQEASWGVGHASTLGYVATMVGYRDASDWIEQLRDYLTANRDHAVNFIKENMPQLKITTPEGTYLMWIDCNALGLQGTAADFFKEQAKVVLNDGEWFGRDGNGDGFVRLNFACPRAQLDEALSRIHKAVQGLQVTTD